MDATKQQVTPECFCTLKDKKNKKHAKIRMGVEHASRARLGEREKHTVNHRSEMFDHILFPANVSNFTYILFLNSYPKNNIILAKLCMQ